MPLSLSVILLSSLGVCISGYVVSALLRSLCHMSVGRSVLTRGAFWQLEGLCPRFEVSRLFRVSCAGLEDPRFLGGCASYLGWWFSLNSEYKPSELLKGSESAFTLNQCEAYWLVRVFFLEGPELASCFPGWEVSGCLGVCILGVWCSREFWVCTQNRSVHKPPLCFSVYLQIVRF